MRRGKEKARKEEMRINQVRNISTNVWTKKRQVYYEKGKEIMIKQKKGTYKEYNKELSEDGI